MSEDKETSQHMTKLMNPRVREVEIGIRALRKVQIYPLSLSDQFTLNDLVTEGISLCIGDKFTPETASKLVDLVRTKLPKMFKMLIPDEKPEKLLKELDNYQLATIAEIVFNDNYGDPVKKLASLFSKPKTEQTESALERLTQLSAGTTPATESSTSPDSATKKVESPVVN